MTASDATTVAVTRDGGGIRKGDAGGPALREQDGKVLLAAVHSAFWQAGCFGSEETRPGAVETRTDDIVDWVTQVRGLPKDPQVASGDFNGDGREDIAAFYDNGTAVDGKRRSTLLTFQHRHRHQGSGQELDRQRRLTHRIGRWARRPTGPPRTDGDRRISG
ncbi:hypothetical protein ACIP6I_25665 [Streptomyces anulatus]